MLFKVDENLRSEVAELLRSHGHDAMTVREQNMRGATDERLAVVCQREGRAIVTQDTDFQNIQDYPPQQYAGIIVLLLRNQSGLCVLQVVTRLITELETESLNGCLWIADESRTRIRCGEAS